MSEMNVSLTPELEKIVADRVASGRYASATDVVAEALRLLDEHDRARNSPLSAKELLNSLKQSGFIGMWKDRSDIEDNIDFARRLRIDAERRSQSS
jgi:antitoxin ParD1/3/4